MEKTALRMKLPSLRLRSPDTQPRGAGNATAASAAQARSPCPLAGSTGYVDCRSARATVERVGSTRSFFAPRNPAPVGYRRSVRSVVAAAALLALAAAFAGGMRGGMQPQYRVLFVGNSLTAANDLPGVVESVSGGRIVTRTVAPGGVSLEDHWTLTGAREALDDGPWDWSSSSRGRRRCRRAGRTSASGRSGGPT